MKLSRPLKTSSSLQQSSISHNPLKPADLDNISSSPTKGRTKQGRRGAREDGGGGAFEGFKEKAPPAPQRQCIDVGCGRNHGPPAGRSRPREVGPNIEIQVYFPPP